MAKAPAQLAPPSWNLADAQALKALARGEANADQQRRALKWIVEGACLTYDLSFHPESDRLTSLAEGRRFVGTQIVKLVNIDLARLKRTDGGASGEQG